ncbi:NUDIX domain-containing protein [Kitasatospora sp. NPDC001574]
MESRNESPRRLGALVLVRAPKSVLLVKTTYRPDWILPGGGANPGEPVAAAAARELAEETGLRVRITHALAIDQMPANGVSGACEGLNIVCDGGMLSAEEAAVLSLPARAAEEIEALAWVEPDDLHRYVEPFMEGRIRSALASVMVGVCLPLLYNGEAVGAA